jgi:hypothetical protein
VIWPDELQPVRPLSARAKAKALRAPSQNKETILGVIFNLCVTFKKQSDS